LTLSIIRVVFEFPPIVGGSVTHIVELSRKMNPHLEKQIIIAPNFPGGEIFDEMFEIQVIRLPYIKLLSFKDFLLPSPILFFYAKTVIKHVAKEIEKGTRVDLIHVHGSMLGCFIKMYLKIYRINVPLIIMQHGYGRDGDLGAVLSAKITRNLLALFPPDYMLLLDDGSKIEVTEKAIRKVGIKYHIVYHGIDNHFFTPKNNEKHKDFVILYPHRVSIEKRPDLAIKIFSKFLGTINQPNIKLIILGAKDNRELIGYAKKKKIDPYIEFAAKTDVNGVRRYLNSCDVVIGTSLESNMNRAIQEAMACEKVVIVFDSGETGKLVKHMQNGILVPAGNTHRFADGLIEVYKNPSLRSQLGVSARESIVSYRNWDIRVRSEFKAYHDMVKDNV